MKRNRYANDEEGREIESEEAGESDATLINEVVGELRMVSTFGLLASQSYS